MQQKSEINFKKDRKIDRQTLNQIKRQIDKHYSRKRDRQHYSRLIDRFYYLLKLILHLIGLLTMV